MKFLDPMDYVYKSATSTQEIVETPFFILVLISDFRN